MRRRLRLLVVAGVLGILATSPLVVREVTTRAWPGEESWALSALDPQFRGCLERTLGRLWGQGHVPVIRATWRDAARQRFYVGEGASQTMDSYHRKRLAADVAAAEPGVGVLWAGVGSGACAAAGGDRVWPVTDIGNCH